MSRVSLIALSTAAALAAGPARAADIYQPAAPPPTPYGSYVAQSPLANWTGAYLGAQVGYGWGDVSNHYRSIGSRTTSMDGAVGGIYGGINAMVAANFVVGAEADFTFSGFSSTQVLSGSPYKNSSDWNGTVRARAGVALDRFMPYLTAGLAFADSSMKRDNYDDDQTLMGVALGMGVEGMITDRIVGRVEYMYLGLEDAKMTIGKQKVTSDFDPGMLRAGLSYRF